LDLKPDALANLTQSKNRKHAIPYEQANHAFFNVPYGRSDAYGKLSDDFACFLWMLANSASTNSRLFHHLKTSPMGRLTLLPHK
jgi:hypothetical protein